MSFSADLAGFARLVVERERNVFVRTTQELQRSVVEGSEITGAPGQPVDTGTLKGSWIGEFVNEHEWQLTTNQEHAPPIEAGIGPNGPLTIRSPVGGTHSVALTVAGFPRIVEVVADEVVQ